MKILICEDDDMMLKAVEFKLTREDHEIISAKNGKDGSELLKKEQFDMLITDLLMPYVSGLELINLIRNELKLDLPIIMLSKVGQEDTVLEALNMGADDYITKPFSPNELSIRIKKLAIRR